MGARVASEVVNLYQELTTEADGGAVETHDVRSVELSATELLPGSISRLRGSDIRITELVAHLQKQDEARNNLEEKLRHSAATAARLRNGSKECKSPARRCGWRRWCNLAAVRERLVETNHLLHGRSISLAESEARVVELTNNLRRQLKATRKLSRLLDDLDSAAARLRSSRRWKIANPVAALKAMLFPKRRLLGYGHLEKIVSAYAKWRSDHSEVDKVDDAIHALESGANSTVSANGAVRHAP